MIYNIANSIYTLTASMPVIKSMLLSCYFWSETSNSQEMPCFLNLEPLLYLYVLQWQIYFLINFCILG